MVTRHLRIHGRVQGVGFRYSMLREAKRLGLSGWVRNRRDGSVEALVQGKADIVAAMVAWAKQGPPGAQVTEVSVANADGEPAVSGFEQWATL
jgi:acylphosphatase